MTRTPIETLMFRTQMQGDFAKVSGDWNPIHLDKVAARRTALGRPLVHGMHTVLCALESLAKALPVLPVPLILEAKFVKPVYVGDTVDILQVDRNGTELQLRAQVDGAAATDVHIVFSDSYGIRENQESCSFDVGSMSCRESSLAEVAGRSGSISQAAKPEMVRERFPHSVKWLGVDNVTGLLCLSRLVGMECPGLYSLFSAFAIQCQHLDTPPVLEYQVVSLDERFRLLKMNVNGLGIRGRVEAFVRHPPIAQMGINEVSALVTRGEFAGQRCLVVGGSRGLGELTAKLLAAGGGHPIITYAVGEDDALRVARMITEWGGRCDIMKYDARVPARQQLEFMTSPISHVYYYATCPIFGRRTRNFDSKVLDEFIDFYVRGFYELCMAVQEIWRQGISVFYPSSVAVEDRPRGMAEYAMAKAAGEVLCADLNRFCPGMHITSARLPRLMTDQTAGFTPTRSANTAEVILPIVRSVQSIRP